jgi:retron-type reverse transcriptase
LIHQISVKKKYVKLPKKQQQKEEDSVKQKIESKLGWRQQTHPILTELKLHPSKEWLLKG